MFVRTPKSTSAEAVHVIDSPAASVVFGQLTAKSSLSSSGVALSSTRLMSMSVAELVFVTT
jgi:hypothetical protein